VSGGSVAGGGGTRRRKASQTIYGVSVVIYVVGGFYGLSRRIFFIDLTQIQRNLTYSFYRNARFHRAKT
jgi:hypothetical protein